MIALHRFALLYCLNAMWQIPLLYVTAVLSYKMLSRSSVVLRHRVWTGTFFLCLALPMVSATEYPRAFLEHAFLQTRQVSQSASIAIVAGADREHAFTRAEHSLIPKFNGANVLLVLWTVCILYRVFQIAWAYRRIARIVAAAHLSERNEVSSDFLSYANGESSGVALKILISEEVGMPATAGILRPVVLLPKVLAGAERNPDLNAVLAHENAHIARRDFMWNLIFEILAIPAFYNPAMRRVLGYLSETREVICDRMAAERTGGNTRYAQSLVRISEMLLKPIPSTAPALGLLDGQILENRVMSLLDQTPRSTRKRTIAMALLSVSLFAPCCVATASLSYQPAALVAADLQPYAGTWHWMFKGKPFVTMQLVVDKDHFTGYMTNGFFSYDGDGNMTDAGSHPGRSAIVRSFFAGSTLHIVVQDDHDKSLSEWAMTLTGAKTAEFTTADPESPKNFKPWAAERTND